MKILTTNQNVVCYYGEVTRGMFPKVDPDTELYRIEQDGNILWAVAQGLFEHEVDSISDEVKSNLSKYCYTTEKGFYVNPNWHEPEPTLEEQVAELKAQNEELSATLDNMLTDVIPAMLTSN